MPIKLLLRHRLSLVASALAMLVSIPAIGTITVEQMRIAAPASAFNKGYQFPLIGIHDAKPTFISARVYKWSQHADEMYVLEPTDDFTVYPQLLRMGSDSRKSVIIKAARPLSNTEEAHYRLVLREFDRADGTDAPQDDDSASMSLAAKPQVSVPMIVSGPASLTAAPMQVVSVQPASPLPAIPGTSAKPGWLLRLYNPGQIYQRIVAIAKNEPAGSNNQFLGYVLPGQRVDVPIKDVKTGDHITVQYVTGSDAKVDGTGKKDDLKSTEFTVP